LPAIRPMFFRKRLPKIERRELLTLSTEQSVRLLDTIRHTRTYWPALIALTTRMRRGEILGLHWKNVHLERGTVRVVESIEQTKSGLRFKAPKTEKTRAITLPAFAVDELRRLKKQQTKELDMLGLRFGGQTLVCG
jgi:integrase